MRYLFLDIDGVLNHDAWYTKLRNMPAGQRPVFPVCCFDPLCVGRVNDILDLTGARLVLSSSWRTDKLLVNTFRNIGLPKDYDCIPFLAPDIYVRGDEIEKYLDERGDDPDTDNYCIIDDSHEFLPEQEEHVALTDPKTGLTPAVMRKAVEILMKN